MSASEPLPPVVAEAQAILNQKAADIVSAIATERHQALLKRLMDEEVREDSHPHQGSSESGGST